MLTGGLGRFTHESMTGGLAASADGWIDDEHGHLTLLEHRVAEVHDWLLSHS